MEWGTPVQWGRFLLFCVLQSVKTKETNPTRPGSPTPCKQALKDCKVHEKKKQVVVLFSRPRQNVKLGTFTLQSCSDGKEMCKKSVMHVQSCCFTNLNLLLFCRSRCRRRRRCLSSLLSLPLRGLFKMMLHETIRKNDFQRNTALHYWNNVATIGSNVATVLCCSKNRCCE